MMNSAAVVVGGVAVGVAVAVGVVAVEAGVE